MLEINYQIQLNDSGRPCIDLAPNYKDKPEDKFFSIELARYILQDTYNRRNAEFDANTARQLENAINMLGQVGDEIAGLLYDIMKTAGQAEVLMGARWHLYVESIEERDAISEFGIIRNGKLFAREEGLKVVVLGDTENKIYELRGGRTNEYWVEI